MLFAIFLFILGFSLIIVNSRRSSYDTYLDLADNDKNELDQSAPSEARLNKYTLPLFTAAVAVLTCTIIGKSDIQTLIAASIVGMSGCHIVQQKIIKIRQAKEIEEIEYSLPIIMERLVMAAEAGLDVIPSLKAVVCFDRDVSIKTQSLKSINKLLKKVVVLSEQGMSFERSLAYVSKSVKSNSLQHAFIHLGIAFKEGGELLGPLRELSDSSQLLYQETVEEEIAKLPVKATMPLVVIFAGLVLCIMAMPLVQILSFTGELMLNGK